MKKPDITKAIGTVTKTTQKSYVLSWKSRIAAVINKIGSFKKDEPISSRDEIIRLASVNLETMSILDIVSNTDQIIDLVSKVELTDGERLWVQHDLLQYSIRSKERLGVLEKSDSEAPLHEILHAHIQMSALLDFIEAW